MEVGDEVGKTLVFSDAFALLGTLFINLLLGISIFSLILFLIYEFFSKWRFLKTLEQYTSTPKSFLLIKIRKESKNGEADVENFLRSLHRVLPNNTYISLEMVSLNQFLSFYIVVPKRLKSTLESQLYAQFQEAEIEETNEFLPNFTSDKTAFAEIKFKKASTNPISTYQTLKEDLLKSLSAILSKTEVGENVYIQVVLKRVGSKFWQRNLRAGYYKLFGARGSDENPNPTFLKLSQEDLYLGKIRFAYIASTQSVAEAKLNTVISLFKLLKSPYTEYKKKRLVFSKELEKLFRARVFEGGQLYTNSELATIWHFPHSGNVVSNVVNTTSKRAPAPDILPTLVNTNPKEVSIFGETNFRNEARQFGIKRIDRRRHLYIVGKTGSGKSRLLQMLLVSDITQGKGCCLIDPHGDLATELLQFIPKSRIEETIYIDPTDRDFPIGFNPLEPVQDYQMRQHLSTFFIAIFKKLFAASWNPRMEHMIRYITLALLETPDSSVLGIPRLLSDTAFRQRVIKQIQDPVVKGFWVNEFSGYNEKYAAEAVIPIVNKVGQFISNPIIRNMVGQARNSLDFEKFMNEGKIVLINLSKGKLGEENAALLGSMFITKIQQAALARAKILEEKRVDFYFYVDEFQNFATDAFSSILSESRKYHLDLTIAHQYMAQLPEEVRATAFGNVGTIISFAVGGDDAGYLEKEYAPTFGAQDIINLNTREMYIKMSIDGKLTSPFSARTLNTPSATNDFSVEVINKTRSKYAKTRVTVENEIAKWSQSVEAKTSSDSSDFPEPIV